MCACSSLCIDEKRQIEFTEKCSKSPSLWQVTALLIGICSSQILLNQAGIQSTQGIIFCFITTNCNPAMTGVLYAFPRERPLFYREYKDGLYRSDAYYLSKVISLVSGDFVLERYHTRSQRRLASYRGAAQTRHQRTYIHACIPSHLYL